jgi:hypothetical protein
MALEHNTSRSEFRTVVAFIFTVWVTLNIAVFHNYTAATVFGVWALYFLLVTIIGFLKAISIKLGVK